MLSRLAILTVASCSAVALLVGCTSGTQPRPTPTPTLATEKEAFAAAESTYRAYVSALNDVDLSDPKTFEPVFAWTTGDANAQDRKSFSQMHADGWVVDGTTKISLMLPSRTRPRATSRGLSWTMATCLDVSDVRLTDREGAEVPDPDHVEVQSMEVTFVPSADTTTKLRISVFAGREGEPSCTQ
jgi:hypothetical protein